MARDQGEAEASPAFDGEPRIEQAIEQLGGDPAKLDGFVRQLLDEQLWAIQGAGGPDEVDGQPVLRLRTFQAERGEFYALFTSPRRLRPWLLEGDRLAQVTGRTFFNTVRGHSVVIDPGSDHCIEVGAPHIEALVGGAPRRIPIPAGTELILGQPAERPEPLLEALADYLLEERRVRRAFLAQVALPAPADSFLAIGLETADDIEPLGERVVANLAARGLPSELITVLITELTIVPIVAGDAISDYMRSSTRPFYVQPLLKWLFS